MADLPQIPDVDDAIQYIISYLCAGRKSQYSTYGYQLYLSNLVLEYLKDSGVPDHNIVPFRDQQDAELSRVFYAAAWELSRRGILRPGKRMFSGQATDDGGSGQGYSVTPYGEAWIREASTVDLLPTQPGRFAKMLADAGKRFGAGFVERSQESVKAYHANAFLACCAMCGAAVESIILALAIAKKGDEKKILDMYSGAAGRGRVEAYLLGGQALPTREEFQRYTTLLKYWRDSSAHGRAVKISEPEAYQSLALLLRFTLFAKDRWDDLTT